MRKPELAIYGICILLLSNSWIYSGTVVFSENFDSGLANWFYRPDYVPLGGAVISSDPDNGNVLSFSLVTDSGHIFSNDIFSVPENGYLKISFDYKGIDDPISDGSGGYFGIAQELPGSNHSWLFGADNRWGFSEVTSHLSDNIGWSRYTVNLFAGSIYFTNGGKPDWSNSFRLMIEDDIGPTGNAYFDNITVESVPEPCSFSLLLAGGVVLLGMRNTRKNKI